jgi:TolB protein
VAYWADETRDPWTEGPHVLYLVSPTGDRYELAAWRPGGESLSEIGGISNNGTHVVATTFDPVDFSTAVVSVAIPSGRVTEVVSFPAGYVQAGTTLPTGRDVVVSHEDPNDLTRLAVYRTDGSLWAEIDRRQTIWGYPWLYGLDGTFLVITDANGLAVYDNQGSFVRQLDTPGGDCEPVRWWTADTVLARCVPFSLHQTLLWYNVLYLVPLDGSPAMAMTPTPADPQYADFGHADVWVVGGRTLLQAFGDCAAQWVERYAEDTSVDYVDMDVAGSPWIVTTAGDDLVVFSVFGCGDYYGPLDLVDVDGNHLRTLVPHINGYMGVTSAKGVTPVP